MSLIPPTMHSELFVLIGEVEKGSLSIENFQRRLQTLSTSQPQNSSPQMRGGIQQHMFDHQQSQPQQMMQNMMGQQGMAFTGFNSLQQAGQMHMQQNQQHLGFGKRARLTRSRSNANELQRNARCIRII